MTNKPDPWKILRSKTELPQEEIDALGYGEAWALVRKAPKPPRAPRNPDICFTGFGGAEKKGFQSLATQKGLVVRENVTKELTYLVCGSTAGWRKIEKAQEAESLILDIDQFLELLESGEIPAPNLT